MALAIIGGVVAVVAGLASTASNVNNLVNSASSGGSGRSGLGVRNASAYAPVPNQDVANPETPYGLGKPGIPARVNWQATLNQASGATGGTVIQTDDNLAPAIGQLQNEVAQTQSSLASSQDIQFFSLALSVIGVALLWYAHRKHHHA